MSCEECSKPYMSGLNFRYDKEGRFLCNVCYQKLHPIQGVCNRCGEVSDNLSEDGLCHDCERTIHCMEEIRLDRLMNRI
jgi:predicted amidophosphoribosyltransferase